MAEVVAQNFEVANLGPDELQDFVAAVTRPDGTGTSPLGEFVSGNYAWISGITLKLGNFSDFGENGYRNFYSRRIAKSIYGQDISADELKSIIEIDMTAFACLTESLLEVDLRSQVRNQGLHDLDKARGLALISPNPKAGWRKGVNLHVPDPNYFIVRHKAESQAKISDRIINGMPRQMQLAGLALFAPGDGSSASSDQALAYASARLEALCDILQVSDDELRAVYAGLLRSEHKDVSANFLLGALSSKKLAQKLVGKTVEPFSFDLLADMQILQRAVEICFADLTRADGSGNKVERLWQNILKHVPEDLLDTVLPSYRRTTIASVRLSELMSRVRPNVISLPEPAMVYVDGARIERLAYDKLLLTLSKQPSYRDFTHGQRPASFHAKKLEEKLGLDLSSGIIWMTEQPLSYLLQTVANSTHLPRPITAEAKQKLAATKLLNPKTLELLDKYKNIANSEELRLVNVGGGDGDETIEWLRLRKEKAEQLTSELEFLEIEIKELIDDLAENQD